MAVYDPNKKYTWSPDDKLEITGAQFAEILNTFRAILSTQEAQIILKVQQANNAVEDIIAKAVEDNIVKEIKDEES